jgi:hypothetical protein
VRVHRLSTSFLIAVTLLGTSGLAWAQGDEEGEAAPPSPAPPPSVRDVAAAYRGARFDECVTIARQLLDPKRPDHLTEPSDVDAATTYLGTCLVRTGRTKQAEDLFEQWIYAEFAKRNAVPAKPNVALYGAAAAEAYDVAYERVSARLEIERKKVLAARDKAKDDAAQLAKAEAERQAALLEFASHETVVTRNRRWIATVPFGVGQFQNGKPGLGWLFLTTEAAAAAVTLGGMVAEIELAAHAPNQVEGRREADNLLELNSGQDRARLTWVVGLYAFTALAAGGIAEAHLNYVPQFEEVRERPVPKELREPPKPQARVRIAPLGLPRGAGLGVTGRF